VAVRAVQRRLRAGALAKLASGVVTSRPKEGRPSLVAGYVAQRARDEKLAIHLRRPCWKTPWRRWYTAASIVWTSLARRNWRFPI